MEDCSFQQQLHALKERVSELSSKYSPSVRMYDPFADQLYDLKARIASMQNRLAHYERSMEPTTFNKGLEESCVESKSFETYNRFALPSGPLFWQLFESLRTDIQSLDSRVASLESSISDLEDRVDGLDPNRFTPPESTTGSEGNPFSQIGGTNGVSYTPYTNIRELSSGANFNVGLHQNSVPTGSFHRMLEPPQSSSLPTNSYLQPDATHLQKWNNIIPRGGCDFNQENNEVPQLWQDTHSSNRRGLSFMSPSPELPTVIQQSPTEGVAFRDREITRLDEQLRAVQEALRAADEALAQKQALIVQLQRERDDLDVASRDWAATNIKWKEQAMKYCSRAQANEGRINDLNKQLGERAHEVQEWERSWNRLNDAYQHVNVKIQTCERTLREEREQRESAIDRLAGDHEAKVKSLQSFCKEKDMVIYNQEQLIGRGGKLLEQSEDEIDGLRRELRSLKDDKEHAIRVTHRTARLLEERDAELSQLKELSRSRDATRNNVEVLRKDSSPRDSHRTRAGEHDRAVNARHPVSQAGRVPSYEVSSVANAQERWSYHTHKANNSKRPVWENKQSGSANEGSRRHSSAEKRPNTVEDTGRGLPYWSDVRHSGQLVPQPNRVGGETSSQPIIAEPSHQRVLDRPPLPAPVLPARPRHMAHVASEANLRTNNAIPARKSLSKYQSMVELRGRNLQPYVESDVEGGEFGGEV